MKALLLLSIYILLFSSCSTRKTARLSAAVSEQASDLVLAEAIQLRRTLHRQPELAGGEIQTKKLIIDYLSHLGLEVETNAGDNSVIGILKTGKPGKNIAWRTDMDALPMDLQEDVDFRSLRPCVSHGCGHDAHIAIALGIAKVLSEKRQSLRGTLYFIFQPEEETFVGAKKMLKSAFLSSVKLDEIYALHVTALPLGQIMLRPNEIFAHQRRVMIKFDRNVSRDSIKRATSAISAKLRRTNGVGNPADISLLSDPNVGLTSQHTVFADYCFVDDPFVISENELGLHASAYLYETDVDNIAGIIPSIRQVLHEQGLDPSVRSIAFVQENITIENDAKLTREAMAILTAVQPQTEVVLSQGLVPYFNDDFAYFQQSIPGVYFLLGASVPERGIIAMNHTADFQIDEACLGVGINQFSTLLFHRAIE